jgi:hypothetical protein
MKTMKKIYLFLAMFFVASGAWGQSLYEDFNYTVGGNVGNNCTTATCTANNNWFTHSNTAGNSATVTVLSGSLAYAGLQASTGNRVTVPGSNTTLPRDINRPTGLAASQNTIYYSFLLSINDNTQLSTSGTFFAAGGNGYFLHLSTTSGTGAANFFARVAVRSTNAGANFRLGIADFGNVFTEFATDLGYATTYLVVVKYVNNPGGSDVATLWVNPASLGGAEPGGGVSNSTSAGNVTGYNSATSGICIRNSSNTPKADYDEIRVGTTWSSVTPVAGGTTATLANLVPQSSGNITQGTGNAILAGFSITPTASVDFTAITIASTGTATSTDISNVRIFKDNDGNGAINGADAAVGGATPQSYSASMVFTGITGETGLIAQTNYLVVADIAGVGVSTPGTTTTASSNTFTTTATSNNGTFTGNSRTIVAPPGATTITAGAGTEAATISSLINTQGAAVLNFDFTIQDDGATPATDGVATQISQIILNAGTGNTVTNWTTAILGVELSDGTNSTTTATIGTSGITFTGISNAIGELGHIADDATKTYTLKIWLKTNLGALRTVIDGQNFVFRIQTADVTVTGSQLATGQDVNSGAGNNVVDVAATALAFVIQPSNTGVNAAMSNVTVSANDANGNRDLGSSVSVAITSTGTLTGSPVTIAAVSGLATFAGLTHTVAGTGLTLNAERSGTLDWDVTSNTFNITSASLAAWDFTGPGNTATFIATTFNANLVSAAGANDITRGATAGASAGVNSFRTTGFQNNGIATSNTDYFQVTLTAQPGFELSLSSIDGFLNGTAGFAVAPGVSNQFAYSLDGTNFTLIGSPSITTGQPVALPTIDITGVSALQNVSAGTTVTLRYYASGQTTTGGWGFFSSAAGVNGLAIGGSIVVSSTPNLSVSSGSLAFGSQAVGTNSTSQSIDLSGVNLTGAPGLITVTAPSTDFQVANDNSTWGPTTTIAYGTGTLAATPVYVRFTPQTAGPKSGNVTFSGGGDATPPTVAVSGSGVANYYSKSSGNLTDVATWGIATNGTGTSPSDFTTAGQTFNVRNRIAVTLDADWIVSGAGSKIVIGDGVAATDLTIPPTLTITGLIDISALGELTVENSTVTHTYGTIATTSTIEYAQTGSFTVPNSITYGNLRLTGGTKTLASNTTTVNGNLVFDNIILGAPGAPPFATIDLNGNLTYVGAVTNPGDANSITLLMNGGVTQTITGNGNTVRVFRLTSTSTTNVVLATSTNVLAGNAAGGGVEIGAGSTIDVGDNTITTFLGPTRINGIGGNTGTFIVTANSAFLIESTSTFNSTLYFNGVNNTVAAIGANFTTTGQLVIATNVQLTSSLTITAGKVQIAEGVTVNLPASANLAGTFSNTAYFITAANTTTGAKGFLRIGTIPAGNFTFPVGTATSYLPVTLNPSTTSDFSVNTFTGITQNGEPNGTAFTAAQKADVVDAVWIVNRNGGTGDVTMTTAWPAALEGADFMGFADNQIGIAHNDGTDWGVIVGTGDNTANTATRTAVNTFSPFAVGGLVGAILPVNFGTVKATQQSSSIKVDWSNMTELEVVNYSIERSADGRNFVSIGSVNARLNNGSKADYSFIDANPFAGVNYYRIRSFEASGKIKYSIIVKVDIRGGATQIVLYPNPVRDGQLSYQANNLVKGLYTIRVFNNSGQQVFTKTLNHPGGSVSEAIVLPSLRAGIYSLQLSSDDNKFVKTFVVQ